MKSPLRSPIAARAAAASLVFAFAATAWPAPSFTVMDPRDPKTTTSRTAVNVLGRATELTTVTVGGVDVPVFGTGLFVRDQIPLAMGMNQIAVAAPGAAEIVLQVERFPEPAPPDPAQEKLAILKDSVIPSRTVAVPAGEAVLVGFRGTSGATAQVTLPSGQVVGLAEAVHPVTGAREGRYEALIPTAGLAGQSMTQLSFRLSRGDEAPADLTAAVTIDVWDDTVPRYAIVRAGVMSFTGGLHEVRLGGPFIAEATSQTIVRVTGLREGQARIQLTPQLEGWAPASELELLPPGTPGSHLYFNNISISGTDDGDAVTIPFATRVPYQVTAVDGTDGVRTIHVDLFGAHDAATWISHRATRQFVRSVHTETPGTDHLRAVISLDEPMWGYRTEVTTGALTIHVRRAPSIAAAPASPLKGLRIAVDAGHGGSDSGARGRSGSMEKDINRWTSDRLMELLREAGAETVDIRVGDESLTMTDRVRRIHESGAHLFISVHANAAGTDRGYLRVGGPSMYYKHAHGRDLAAVMQEELLETSGMMDFGVVGNFNFTPIRRATEMPAVLIELAFMSNPSDEAQMLDAGFRDRMARASLRGVERYLDEWRKRQARE